MNMIAEASAEMKLNHSVSDLDHGTALPISTTLSTCPSSSGNVSDILATPPPKSKCHLLGGADPLIVSAPLGEQSWQSIEQRMCPDVSYDIEEYKNIKEYIPEWGHEDVDVRRFPFFLVPRDETAGGNRISQEIMVLSPKPKTITLDTIPEDSEVHCITASDFDLIRPMYSNVGREDELYLGRKSGASKLYAVKVIRRSLISDSSVSADHARVEQTALRLLTERQVPFITRLHWSFHDNAVFYMVTDFCPGGSLRAFVHGGKFEQGSARFYTAEIAEGISALHASGIVHRELTPENVLLDRAGHVALSDFGSAMFSSDAYLTDSRRPGRAVGVRGSGLYHAPEVIMGWTHDRAVDWWAFGMLVYFMLTGQHPFVIGGSSSAVHRSILESHILHGEFLASVSDLPAQDLISKCLERNPAMRITEDGVRAHAYFGDVDWQQVREKKILGPIPFVPKFEDNLYEINSFPTSPGQVSSVILSPAANGIVGDVSFTWGLDSVDTAQEQYTRMASDAHASAAVLVDSLETDAVSPSVNIGIGTKSEEELDTGLSIPAELGGRQSGAASPPIRRGLGTLRKYSSLNFDLDTLASAPFGSQDDISRPSPQPSNILRKSQSQLNCGSPLSLQETPDTSRWRNKLRKKSRPDISLNFVHTPQPPLALPQGVEQIGNGIGYTRRSDPYHSRLSIATLTPRTCYALFSGGRLPSMPAKFEPKEGRNGQRSNHAGVAVMEGPNQSEDQMDAVMREMYGSTWNLGLSATDLSSAGADPRAYAALGRPCVGLGYGETPFGRAHSHARNIAMRETTPTPMVPAELRSLSPASTLRLVSPSTTPRMDLS
ncbi:predicted protein [Sparassis crispa]|uniref:Protein kinase domain-containing protein n=1 Tax=Sparassis crispa TaxID=139825 RepID=A0A401G913_9APHY|nr:predicted protein [Sparassis crispa]GBE78629.1 predicted protein [Sparassis crispa]